MQETMNRFEKAARLVFEGKVRPVPEGRTFLIPSSDPNSHAVYLVAVLPSDYSTGTGFTPPRYSCTCKWGRAYEELPAATGKGKVYRAREECSHVLAARALMAQAGKSADPFARFDGRD